MDRRPAHASVADRVREALDARGLTQRRLASEIGLDHTKLSKSLSERRRFSIDELQAIARTVDVPLDWLVSGEGEQVVRPQGSSALSDVVYDGAAGETRRRIIVAATDLIARGGQLNLRISDVAERAGVSSAAIHYHFDNRQLLLQETLRFAARTAYERQVAGLLDVQDGAERLLRLIELQLPTPGPLRDEWSIWLQVWNEAAVDPQIRVLHADAYSRWQETVRSAIVLGQRQGSCVEGDPDEMAARLTAYVDGLGIQVLTGRPGRNVETMRAALHDFLRAHFLVRGTDREGTIR